MLPPGCLHRPVEDRVAKSDHRLECSDRRLSATKILRLAIDGKTVTAYLRTSQSREARSLSPGSLVISTCGGKLVSAPSKTNDSRLFCEIIFSIGPSTC